jgi:hypothetical protein
MTTNYHTAISASATGVVATVNTPLGQLDAAIAYLLAVLLLLEAAS